VIQKKWAYFLLFSLSLIFLPAVIYSDDGKQENFINTTKDKNKVERFSKNANYRSSDASSVENGLVELFGGIIAVAGIFVAAAPYYVPHYFWDKGFSEKLYFEPYPYFGSDGYLTDDVLDQSQSWAIDITPEYKIYDHNTFGYGVILNFRTSFRFEIQADYNYLEEKSEDGSSDSFGLGNINLLFRFAQNPHLLMRSGVGLIMLNDNEDEFGFNFSYSADCYFSKPLFLSARFDVGRLGGDVFVRLRSTVGYVNKNYELDVGFEFYKMEETSLSGLTLGFKVYF
jgi:hypothetical protein